LAKPRNMMGFIFILERNGDRSIIAIGSLYSGARQEAILKDIEIIKNLNLTESKKGKVLRGNLKRL
jgi:hypothetical protein